MNMPKKFISPSKGQFLVYVAEDGRSKLEVRLEDETIWLTQAHLAELFQVRPQNITMHLRNIYAEGELTEEENAVYRHLSDSPVHVDELSLRCARPAAFIGSVLLQLELKRVVKQLPGKLFVK